MKKIYPRSLYLKGWKDLSQEVVVHSKEQEAEARKLGYKKITEFTLPDESVTIFAEENSTAEHTTSNTKKCVACGKDFEPKSKIQKYCSRACRLKK